VVDSQTLTGVALAIIAFALAVLSRIQLGTSFSVRPKATGLVTNGVYSRLQHPMYVFIDITVVGIAIAAHNWYVLLLLMLMIPLQILNTRKERKLLSEKFGERYQTYVRSTWF
jgi:protein-S-isoprenylcysteine O-methyltransferase Ste14